MINGVSAASESSAGIRSPMEFPWLLYWISFKFVTLSGTMLIAGRYENSRLRGVHLSFAAVASSGIEEEVEERWISRAAAALVTSLGKNFRPCPVPRVPCPDHFLAAPLGEFVSLNLRNRFPSSSSVFLARPVIGPRRDPR